MSEYIIGKHNMGNTSKNLFGQMLIRMKSNVLISRVKLFPEADRSMMMIQDQG